MNQIIDAEIIPQKTKVHIGGLRAKVLFYVGIAALVSIGVAFASGSGLFDSPRDAAQKMIDDAKEVYEEASRSNIALHNGLKQQMLIEAKAKAQLEIEAAKTDEFNSKIESNEKIINDAKTKADAARYMISVLDTSEKSFEVKK